MSGETVLFLFAIVVVLVYFMVVPQTSKHSGGAIVPGRFQSIDQVGDYAERSWLENHFHVGSSTAEATIRNNEALSAEAINRKNSVIRAERIGISVEALKAAEVVKMTTDQEIRKHQALKVIDVRVKRLDDHIRLATDKKDAQQWIQISEEIARLERKLEEIDGRAGQKTISEGTPSEVGGAEPATEDE